MLMISFLLPDTSFIVGNMEMTKIYTVASYLGNIIICIITLDYGGPLTIVSVC